jgi:hypothetical protein
VSTENTPNIGHGHFDATGNSHHDDTHSDAYVAHENALPGKPFAAFGHFAPMAYSAPVMQMSVQHHVVTHASCGSRVWHDGRSFGWQCQGCGAPVIGAGELT